MAPTRSIKVSVHMIQGPGNSFVKLFWSYFHLGKVHYVRVGAAARGGRGHCETNRTNREWGINFLKPVLLIYLVVLGTYNF